MADALDKFVLSYEVDSKEAAARLDKLNAKVDAVGKEAGKAKGQFKEFASGAADELGKVVPGVDAVSAAVKTMRGEFAAAGLAIGALAIGVKAVMDLRAQYNAQRKAGMEVGVSPERVEEYQRKFVRYGGGNVNREQALEGVRQVQSLISHAYTDPTRMGTENRQLKLLGINPGERGKGSTNVNTALTGLAERFSKMTPDQVQGVAKAVGLSQDWALALQKIGPAIGKVTEQTKEELQRRAETQGSLARYNDSLSKLNEKFTELSNVVGTELMPPLTKLLEWATKMAGTSKQITDRETTRDRELSIQQDADKRYKAMKASQKPLQSLGSDFASLWGGGDLAMHRAAREAAEKAFDEAHPQSKAHADENSKDTKDKIVDGLDDANKKGAQVSDEMTLAVNLFAGAVASFSNAIDERQAWASWAGELGAAAGLGTDKQAGTTPDIKDAAASVGPTKYDAFISAAAAKYGVDPNLIKRVIDVESKFNPNATSEAGAEGLMQILPSNKKSLGIKNSFDPEQNIMGGTKLLAQYIKEAGNNVRTGLMMFHGGYDRSGWGPRTQAYPGKVLGDARTAEDQRVSSGAIVQRGESRAKLNIRAVQANLAGALGVPIGQIQQGGVNRGDAEFKLSQLEGGIQNQIFNLKRELNTVGLPQSARTKIFNEIQAQQRGLQQLRQFGPGVVQRQQDGPRSITIGERAVIINVTGSGDPAAVAAHVRDEFGVHLQRLTNQESDGVKF